MIKLKSNKNLAKFLRSPVLSEQTFPPRRILSVSFRNSPRCCTLNICWRLCRITFSPVTFVLLLVCCFIKVSYTFFCLQNALKFTLTPNEWGLLPGRTPSHTPSCNLSLQKNRRHLLFHFSKKGEHVTWLVLRCTDHIKVPTSPFFWCWIAILACIVKSKVTVKC